jgi:hypothetical protein
MSARGLFIALLLAVGLVLALSPAPAPACPFCGMQGQTLTREVAQAQFVVFGTLSNPKLSNAADALSEGSTDMTIEEVVKSHPYLKDKKQIVLPKYVPVDREREIKWVIFCDFFKDRVDPYRGLPTKNKDLAVYLKGAMALDEKDIGKRLAFFFNYLDHADVEISTDAYKEFANADYKDVLKMLDVGDREAYRNKIIKWLRDPETPAYRYGLYGYLLGKVGKEDDAQVFHDLVDPKRKLGTGIDGLLAGHVSLQPKKGWQEVLRILGNPSEDFNRRYSALRTVRFLWEFSPDLIKPSDLVAAVKLLLDQGDIADLGIEDLRKWKQWQLADEILALYGKESHNVPIIQRAIIRFTLSCPPENKKAADFVARQRKEDPERVKDIEELLRLETPPPKPAEEKK